MNGIYGRKINIFLLTFPAIGLFTFFVILPLLGNLGLSFFDFITLKNMTFIGLENYKEIFTDPEFWAANARSVILAFLAIFFDTFLGLVFALLLYEVTESLQRLIRASILMPMVLSIVVISQLWLIIYDADIGLINGVLRLFGLESLTKVWLAEPGIALFCVAVVGMWQYFGFSVLIIYSGIRNIPKQYIEAAYLDGATFLQMVVRIKIPLLSEVIKASAILFTVGGMYTFAQIYVMTRGGPGTMTQSLVYYLYSKVFTLQEFGVGTAVAVVALLETMLLIFIIQKTIARQRIEL